MGDEPMNPPALIQRHRYLYLVRTFHPVVWAEPRAALHPGGFYGMADDSERLSRLRDSYDRNVEWWA
jgi:hypothetical protein